MARNRKRAKDRRARRPQPVVSGRPVQPDEVAAPDPIAHAAPDAAAAEAQLALGAPELAEEEGVLPGVETAGFNGAEGGEEPPETPGGELAVPGAPVPAARPRAGSRLVTFLQGSWRELQRVQWPDRRQVMQATGVVIGFVIVAGAFLGVADTIAAKLVNLILK